MESLRTCTECNISKDKNIFGKKSAKCKECLNKIWKLNYEKNKEKYKITNRKYVLKNIDKVRERRNIWNRNKKEQDPLYNLKCKLRTLIRASFNNKSVIKQSKTVAILGCDYEFFRDYIKHQFTENMSWDNIHLDHIKPVSTAITLEDVIILNHYTNFQPLLAKDNLIKNNSLVEKQLKLL